MIFQTWTMCVAAAWLAFAASAAQAQNAQPPAPAGAAAQAAAVPVDPFAAIPPPRAEDVASIDGIVAALYAVISGDAGVKRDWNRFRSLFHPGARMIPTGKNPATGKVAARVLAPEDYVRISGPLLERDGFHEQELVRRVDSFGNIAQLFSSYEARRKLSDAKAFMRGINSIQLFNDGSRWWVTSVTWSQESSDHPLPAQFARRPRR
jgi:hypothetical protein